MEFVHGANGGWYRPEPFCKTWKEGGLDMNKPMKLYTDKASNYHRLLNEMNGKRGIFRDRHYVDNAPMEEPYVPPWRMTMSDTYGMAATRKMKATVPTYDERYALPLRLFGWWCW